MAAAKDVVVDARFGKLVVTKVFSKDGRKHAHCLCDCGAVKDVVGESLGAKTNSCGCWRREWAVTHGLKAKNKRLYYIWKGMIYRCDRPANASYRRYGGRGITVCKAWHSAELFAAWAHSSGYRDDLTIERKDVNGNYEPKNCRWIPLKEQQENRRNSSRYTAWGETKTSSEWRKDPRCRVKDRKVLRERIISGWSPEKAISTPVHGGK